MLKINLQLFAHKKGMGSSKNGRDSKPKMLGLKVGAGQFVKVGMILMRQRGTKIYAGENVKRGKDDTLFATAAGRVCFKRLPKKRKKICVVADEAISNGD